MSALGNADAAEQEEFDPEEDDASGLWTSFGMALRLVVGWLSVAVGGLNLLVELDQTSRQPDGAYLTFHFVLLIGGAVLLALAFIHPRPGPVGYVAGGAVALAGMVASTVPATKTICCLSEFAVRHGFPFTFLARHDSAGGWHVDSRHTLTDLMFWAYVGLFVMIAVSLFGLEPGDEDDEPGPPAGERLYIEHLHGRHENEIGHLYGRRVIEEGRRGSEDGRRGSEDGRHESENGRHEDGTVRHDSERDPREPDERTVGPLP